MNSAFRFTPACAALAAMLSQGSWVRAETYRVVAVQTAPCTVRMLGRAPRGTCVVCDAGFKPVMDLKAPGDQVSIPDRRFYLKFVRGTLDFDFDLQFTSPDTVATCHVTSKVGGITLTRVAVKGGSVTFDTEKSYDYDPKKSVGSGNGAFVTILP